MSNICNRTDLVLSKKYRCRCCPKRRRSRSRSPRRNNNVTAINTVITTATTTTLSPATLAVLREIFNDIK